MTHEQRATARSMMSKGDLTQTPAEQRADFDVLFADLPLGDDVTLSPARWAAFRPWISMSREQTTTR